MTSKNAELVREWLALALGIVGTIAGCLSLYLVWQQSSAQNENLAISINLIRNGYPTNIERQNHIPGAAGTIETKWQVWVTNLSSEPSTLVGNNFFLANENGRFQYSGLFAGWTNEQGKETNIFPRKLDSGDVLNAILTLRYPISEEAVDFALQPVEGNKVAVNDIGIFVRKLIMQKNIDVFGNTVEVIPGGGKEAIFKFPSNPKDPLVALNIKTARGKQFEGYSFWYKMYDPTR